MDKGTWSLKGGESMRKAVANSPMTPRRHRPGNRTPRVPCLRCNGAGWIEESHPACVGCHEDCGECDLSQDETNPVQDCLMCDGSGWKENPMPNYVVLLQVALPVTAADSSIAVEIAEGDLRYALAHDHRYPSIDVVKVEEA